MSDHVAGRELDALIARKVMEWAEWANPLYGDSQCPDGVTFFAAWPDGVTVYEDGDDDASYCFRPSIDVAAAMQVVEKMGEYCCDLTIEKAGLNWWVDFRSGEAEAETLPLAICLAALGALENADPDSTPPSTNEGDAPC